MIELCKVGQTCNGCPAMGLGIELGAEVGATASAAIEEHGSQLFEHSGELVDQMEAVRITNRFSKEIIDDGAPFATAVKTAIRIVRGECCMYKLNNEEGKL